MTKPYTLLIWGYPHVAKHTSTEMLTRSLTKAFGRLPHVALHVTESRTLKIELARADFVVVIEYFAWRPNAPWLKDRAGARKITAFRECQFPEYDHTFDLMHDFPLPCDKDLMVNKPKWPGLILVDHSWEAFWGTENDWTPRIEAWVREIVGPELRPSRLVCDQADADHASADFLLVPPAPYEEYLATTGAVERFIVTHRECHPWGVIDMAARGIQVLSPPGFVPQPIVDRLGIPIFSSKEELRTILARTVGEEWNHKIDLCTDYADIAVAMDRQFQEWLA